MSIFAEINKGNSSTMTKFLKDNLISLRDSAINMSLISGTRWRKFTYENDTLVLKNEIWVFTKNRFSNSGTLDIYEKNKTTEEWKFQSKPKILALHKAGYNIGFITGFRETVLLLNNITSSEYFLFIKENLWIKSQLDLERLFLNSLEREQQEELNERKQKDAEKKMVADAKLIQEAEIAARDAANNELAAVSERQSGSEIITLIITFIIFVILISIFLF